MASAAGSEIVRCIAGGRWSISDGLWCKIRNQGRLRQVKILLKGCLVHCRHAREVQAHIIWPLVRHGRSKEGLACTARLAGEDIRWRLVQARTPLKKRLVHERLLARPELHGCCCCCCCCYPDVIQCSCTAAAAVLNNVIQCSCTAATAVLM